MKRSGGWGVAQWKNTLLACARGCGFRKKGGKKEKKRKEREREREAKGKS
jgi:hypothetical protein